MKPGEKGFTVLELIVTIATIALISGAATATTFQVTRSTKQTNQIMTAVRQVQSAGYWISRDAQMAQSVITDNLTLPDFLRLTWTEWNYDEGETTYHSVTYSLDNLSGGIGKLRRSHWSSAGANEPTLVANYIYYDPTDPDNTTRAGYQPPVLTLRLSARLEDIRESREYRITHRPQL